MHYAEIPWLLEPNFPQKVIKSFQANSNFKGVDTRGIGDPGNTKILRYKKDEIQHHIKKWMKNQECRTRSFCGVVELESAADTGDIRPGQLIFEECTPSQVGGREGTLIGDIYNAFAPPISYILTRQTRRVVFFHVAVYVGCYEGKHYVVENGGHYEGSRNGMIAARPIKSAFYSTAKFFVVSPPRDENDNSTRYMVVQRALSSVGIKYEYDIRAVSCETFALFMVGLFPDLQDIQLGVLKPLITDQPITARGKRKKNEDDSEKYRTFCKSLENNIKSVPEGVILKIDFLIKEDWDEEFDGMRIPVECEYSSNTLRAYNALMDACSTGNTLDAVRLLNQGLDMNSITAYGKTALTIAASRGFSDVCKSMILGVSQIDRTNIIKFKDGNERNALECAMGYNHRDTLQTLQSLMKPGTTEQVDTIRRGISFGNETKSIESLSISSGLFERQKNVQKKYSHPIAQPFSYFYYEVAITGGHKVAEADVNTENSQYKFDIGFSHGEGLDCAELVYCLYMDWKRDMSYKKEVIGCVIDVISNLVGFTRNGKQLGPPLYVGKDSPDCNGHGIVPFVRISPESSEDKQIVLPAIQLTLNYGKEQFEYKGDVQNLLVGGNSLTTTQPLPQMATERSRPLLESYY